MADLKGKRNNKSKLRLKTLPFFLSCSNSNSNDENKSATKFGEEQGVVGLGIVAALNSNNESQKNRVFSVSPRSKPIPIFSNRGSKEDELSEEYTCVISHVGSNLMKKKEYFDDGFKMSYWVSSNGGNGVFCAPSPPVVALVGGFTVFDDGDFLSCCYLCKKKLHGLDIFMYRGEKAFCSEECRYKHISVDEHKEKYARKQKQAESPCSSPSPGPMQFLAGMAAA